MLLRQSTVTLLLFSLLVFSLLSMETMCLLRKFETVGMVPKSYFDEEKTIYAFTERIIDGDTIRVRHIPGYSVRVFRRQKLQRPLQQRGISQETLSIRIYGVDCPELAKNKRQTTQPYGEQAKNFTTDLVLHKIVKITLLRKDQYGRAVAAVETMPKGGLWLKWIPGYGRKDLSMELAFHGLAELYTSGGAVYWGKREELEEKIKQAKKKKRGIWSLGNGRVSAEDHKRSQRQGQQQGNNNANKILLQDATNTVVVQSRGGGGRTTTAKENKNSNRNKKKKPTTAASTKENKNSNRNKSNHKKKPTKQQKRRSTLLEAAVTGLEVVG